ncbi:MAG TPA: ABC transporter ATP-binding protein [Candidatus Goldiibacteriota bacterium]|nr:ABC transporter ATP-binding protein [Candidatus Goldiibacteriota bacterium]
MDEKDIVEIKDLNVKYKISKSECVYALKDVNLKIKNGESIAIVGESGCGKSTFANSLLKLLPLNAEIKGSVKMHGQEILNMSDVDLEKIRGKVAGIIFQEPSASLNPVFTVKEQIEETIKAHYKEVKDVETEKKGLSLLKETGIDDVKRVYNSYPHQLSGGQQQRVMIAIALSCDPSILIADEPTTALDVTVQMQIINLLKKLKNTRNLTLILITHDLHLAAFMSDRIIVMYAGEIVESGKIKTIKDCRHPYTHLLFKVVPDINKKKGEIVLIDGEVPDLRILRNECYFFERCFKAGKMCKENHPEISKNVRCYYPV